MRNALQTNLMTVVAIADSRSKLGRACTGASRGGLPDGRMSSSFIGDP